VNSKEMNIDSEDGLAIGYSIQISGGGKSERNMVVGFGSILLATPLAHSYPSGSEVRRVANDSNETSARLAGSSTQLSGILLVFGVSGWSLLLLIACSGMAVCCYRRKCRDGRPCSDDGVVAKPRDTELDFERRLKATEIQVQAYDRHRRSVSSASLLPLEKVASFGKVRWRIMRGASRSCHRALATRRPGAMQPSLTSSAGCRRRGRGSRTASRC